MVFGSQQIVVLQIWQKKAKTLTCMAFLHLIALRNKMVAHAFLLLFDNANDRLCQERLLGKSEEELGREKTNSRPTVGRQYTCSSP